MPGLQIGRFSCFQAQDPASIARAQGLRHLCFRGQPGLDVDQMDDRCAHYLVTDDTGELMACFRVMILPSGAALGQSYAAQHYDLSRIKGFQAPLLELGRFCMHPDCHDPDVLRLAWAMLAALVDDHGIGMMFGCTSFKGTDPAIYAAAFAHLRARYLAPEPFAPQVRARHVTPLADSPYDMRSATALIPSLLRSYLAMGGWVSDHAVIDHDLQTLHVFTAVEVSGVPAARARRLRAMAG